MITNSINTYYRILGVTANATVNDIKRAYRSKAKELHPDKNRSEDANEQFILLTEAYECLINLSSGKTKTIQSSTSYTTWQEESREETRERARQYADMQFEEFAKTDYYNKTEAVYTVFEHFFFFSAIFILLLPLLGYIFKGSMGLFVGLFITFITVQYWADIFKEKTSINFKSLLQSIIVIVKTKSFQYSIMTLANLYFLFRYALNTQLTFLSFGLILLVLYLLVYLATYYKASVLKYFSKTAIFLCLAPAIFNLFFFCNFIFSTNPTFEKYIFVHEQRWYGTSQSGARLEKIAYIDLENNKYDDYKLFRMFFDFDAMEYKSEITYKFEDGLFGLRVLKSYEFSN
ncbi:MAG: J domain-containing protein [Bacteroidia bacterium]